MKRLLWFLMLNVPLLTVANNIPPEPVMATVAKPTAEETNTTLPTALALPTPLQAADKAQVRALAQAWVIPVGKPVGRANAIEVVAALQKAGFSAFMEPTQTADVMQVLVGPEVDSAHIQQTYQALLKRMPGIGAVTPYNEHQGSTS